VTVSIFTGRGKRFNISTRNNQDSTKKKPLRII
jgi:hypothetical protein